VEDSGEYLNISRWRVGTEETRKDQNQYGTTNGSLSTSIVIRLVTSRGINDYVQVVVDWDDSYMDAC